MTGLAQAMGIPSANLAEAVLDCAAPVTLLRASPSATQRAARGRVNPPVVTSSRISLSVQPMKQSELKLLPEGMRNGGAVKCYGTDELKTVETSACKSPDLFISKGITYQVMSVDDWEDAGGYFKTIATRVNR